MKKRHRISIVILFVFANLTAVGLLFGLKVVPPPSKIKSIIMWAVFAVLFFAMVNEGIMWIKNGKRGELADLVVIGYLFIVVFLATDDVFTSFLGSFSIYLLFGISELKDYEVLNKILYISIITYNIIFFTAILDEALGKGGVWRDTMFSMSFWIMLILGFIFFGRKYIIVWRFMSPQYLTLALYLIAWIAVSTASDITGDRSIMDYIYDVLIVTDLIIYALSGPLLDLMLGMKSVDSPVLEKIINEVAPAIGLNPDKIKIRFGEYPIINAMAYGAFWDKHMSIIAPDINELPEDELRGIVAHELAHLKGKHTLSLTMISIGELYMRKLLDWPATYYDYTFDPEGQPFPLFAFILINIGIYFILYIFVRMFEAQADLNTKRAGYGFHLAKGLYNLESFYANGREIGLNTVLLCDEKITKNNKIRDYVETAEYMNRMMIAPKKSSLLSNFMNSHPPSYHRVIASLHDEDFSISKEAIMPMLFLRKKKANLWFKQVNPTRKRFMQLCNEKIKKEFGIVDLEKLNEKLNHISHYNETIGNSYVFLNLKTKEKILGRVNGIKYTKNTCEPVLYEIEILNRKAHTKSLLNPYLHQKVPYSLKEHYFLRKEEKFGKLIEVDEQKMWEKVGKTPSEEVIDEFEKAKKQGVFKFKLKNSEEILEKPLFKTKLPRSLEHLLEYVGETVYIKKKGSYYPYFLNSVDIGEDLNQISFQLEKVKELKENQGSESHGESSNEKESEKDYDNIILSWEDYVLRFRQVFVPLHNDDQTRKNEQNLFVHIKSQKFHLSVFLKKPVNNEHEGIVTALDWDKKLQKIEKITIQTIFDQAEVVAREKIDFVYINRPTIVFQNKNNISGASKLIHRLIAKYKPRTIMN